MLILGVALSCRHSTLVVNAGPIILDLTEVDRPCGVNRTRDGSYARDERPFEGDS